MNAKNSSATIAVVGSGYVGLVASACFAEIGHRVICVDNDEAKVRVLQQGGVPIHEEHLPELLSRYGGKSLEFTTDLRAATQAAQAVFIAVGTPQSETGSADLSYVDAVASEIARSIDSYKVIVEKSTVPVYTNEWISRVIERNGVPRDLFDVTSNPEFLREGTAVVDFLHPDRIVVGAPSERSSDLLKTIYAPLTNGTYYNIPGSVPGSRTALDPPPILQTSTKAAEIRLGCPPASPPSPANSAAKPSKVAGLVMVSANVDAIARNRVDAPFSFIAILSTSRVSTLETKV